MSDTTTEVTATEPPQTTEAVDVAEEVTATEPPQTSIPGPFQIASILGAILNGNTDPRTLTGLELDACHRFVGDAAKALAK